MKQRQSQRGTWTRGVLLAAATAGLAGCAGSEALDKTASDVLDQAQSLQIYNHQVSLTGVDGIGARLPGRPPLYL